MIDICFKYNIINDVIKVMLYGSIPSKDKWKRWVKSVINDYDFVVWRRELRFYKNLEDYRSIVVKIESCMWYFTCKLNRKLKYACCLVVRLLSGCSILRVHCDTSIPREQRLCENCSSCEIENLEHFIMNCEAFSVERKMFYDNIDMNVTVQSQLILANLSSHIRYLIYMGMDYIACVDDLYKIRLQAACYIYTKSISGASPSV